MTSCWTDSARKGQYTNFTPFARPRSPRTIRSNFGARQAALRRLPVLYLPGRLEGGHARVDEPTRQLIKSIDSAANRGSSRYPSTREASFQVFNDRSRSKRSVRLCLYRSRNRLGRVCRAIHTLRHLDQRTRRIRYQSSRPGAWRRESRQSERYPSGLSPIGDWR